MGKKYEVIWTNTADADLNQIIDYIAQNSIPNAVRVFDKIKKKCSNLFMSPHRGRIVPELKDYGILLYRELLVEPWRVIYRIAKNNVFVLSVIDSRQNVEDVLLSRFVDK